MPASINLVPANKSFEPVSDVPILNHSYPSLTPGNAVPHKAVHKSAESTKPYLFLKIFSDCIFLRPIKRNRDIINLKA